MPLEINPTSQLLNTLLNAGKLLSTHAVRRVNPAIFGEYREVFTALTALSNNNIVADPEVVSQHFRSHGFPRGISQNTVYELGAMTFVSAPIEYLVEAAVRYHMETRIPRLAREITELTDVKIMKQRLQAEVIDFQPYSDDYSLVKPISEHLDAINIRRNSPDQGGIRHGCPGFVDVFPEFRKGKTVFLGAKTKDGKSTVIRQMVLEIALKQRRKTLLFPMENQDEYTVEALVAMLAGVSRTKRTHEMTPSERTAWDEADAQLRELDDILIISHECDINKQIALARQVQPEFVGVDQQSHWSGIQSRGENYTYQLEAYNRKFQREVTRALGCATLILVQMKKDATTPFKSHDTEDSTKMVNIADTMLFLWNPEDVNEPALRIVQMGKARDAGESKPARCYFDSTSCKLVDAPPK
jgi:hypothetical protein